MNVDRFAPWYRWVEYGAFGRVLERRRFAFFHRLRGARRVLVLGEGDGRALRRLLEAAPAAEIDVVELSGAMIGLARQGAGRSERVRFRQEDARRARFEAGAYDAVVTLFFLDCFHEGELRQLAGRLVEAMMPGGQWIVGEFAVPERGWRHWHARAWLWTMYRFFGAVSGLRVRELPPVEELLVAAGLELREREEARWGLIRSEVWRKPIDG